jgi:hypothetical protein
MSTSSDAGKAGDVMPEKSGRRLSFDLSDDQLSALAPLVEATGKVKVVGTLEGNRLTVSHLACNTAFLACNAAFLACNAPFQTGQ